MITAILGLYNFIFLITSMVVQTTLNTDFIVQTLGINRDSDRVS